MIFNKEGSDLFFNKWGIRIQNPIKKSLFKNMIYELTYKINKKRMAKKKLKLTESKLFYIVTIDVL